jgi:membrane associated rhomboid family serine protease
MKVLNDLKLQYKMGDVTTKLIFWNVILFVVPNIVFGFLNLFSIEIPYLNYLGLSNIFSTLIYKPWTLFSYSFFHNGFFHLVFNMLILNFVGKLFVTYFSQKQLLSLYILGGIFAGLVYMISYATLPLLAHQNALLTGASGSIMAVLVGVTYYAPTMNIRLFLFGNIKLWYFTTAILIIDLINLPLENTGGHLAHIGGAVFGVVYIKLVQNGTDLGLGLNKMIDFFQNIFSSKTKSPFKNIHRNPKPKHPPKKTSDVVTKSKIQQQIDDILDKISTSGYDSLSKDEKEFLFKSGNL